MSNSSGPEHVVVDGSNIATEGRSLPSLKQLQEAVMGFMEEYPDTAITVVVDATFGHRIDKKETKEFEEGIANNELVAPPAGAVGRGDAFVLGIADKAGASVLSNDSFQEFHGEYEWLFHEGRLIGGKPVPHVGWVWVDRVPVRGPVSRKATGSKRGRGGSGTGGGRSRSKSDSGSRRGSKEASEPMPVPKSPPPSKKAAAKKTAAKKTATKKDASRTKDAIQQDASRKSNDKAPAPSPGRAPKGGEAVNDLMPFLDFVEHHAVGTTVDATVDAYSSHGAYVIIRDSGVRGYLPLRLMADPAPRSAKKLFKIGDEIEVVVVSFAAPRRSIDCAVPDMADAAIAAARAEQDDEPEAESTDRPPAEKRATRKKAAARKKAPAKKTAAKKTAAKKTAAKKTAAKKTPAKKTPAKKAPAKKAAAKKAPAKKAAAKKTAAKKSAAKKTPAKKTAAKKTPAKKTAAKKTPAKKTAGRKRAATKKAASSGGGEES